MEPITLEQIPVRSVVAHLLEKGYATFELPEIIPYIDPIFEDYKYFLSQPDEFKKKWTIHIPELSLKADHGYIPPKGEGFDPKHTFQWRADLKDMLIREQRLSLEEFAPYKEWMACQENIFRILKKTMLQLAKELDVQLSGNYDLFGQLKLHELNARHVIRLLKYNYDPSRPKSDPLASKHTDQGTLTFQWNQSCRGLSVIAKDGTVVRYEYVPGRVIVIFGKKIIPATNGFLEPTEHYVDSDEERDRTSGIFFVHTGHKSIELR